MFCWGRNTKSNKNSDSKVKDFEEALYKINDMLKDDDMILIKKYESIAQAVRETGVNSKSIRDTAKGIQKYAGRFVWKYCD